MKMSEKREQDLYNSIAIPIEDLRVKLASNSDGSVNLDLDLYDLNQEIWRCVHKTLNLENY